MYIMKVMKDIVSMIQKRFEKYDLIIADELAFPKGIPEINHYYFEPYIREIGRDFWRCRHYKCNR